MQPKNTYRKKNYNRYNKHAGAFILSVTLLGIGIIKTYASLISYKHKYRQ